MSLVERCFVLLIVCFVLLLVMAVLWLRIYPGTDFWFVSLR